ncbi:hypothetical protein PsorP6_003747 [Peronosclerospora sorghi]|uniref:Uncharacterized protein n=1 Tax=Peronosclerospora sorghi TaxID=230839 RepID=A0ACC0VQ75_9STRA|nr:hypothetical protein PsorP6_003747 [Peronosclerospora sorghi]
MFRHELELMTHQMHPRDESDRPCDEEEALTTIGRRLQPERKAATIDVLTGSRGDAEHVEARHEHDRGTGRILLAAASAKSARSSQNVG